MDSIPPPGKSASPNAPSREAAFRCIPPFAPRWLRRRPLLLAALFAARNRARRNGWILLLAATALGVLVWISTWPVAARALTLLADWPMLGFIVGAAHAITSVSRRRPRVLAEHERSWLAALPHRVSAAVRISFALLAQLAGLAAMCAIAAAAGTVPWSTARTTWLTLLAGYIVGAIAGWFAHSAVKAPAYGSQYAVVRRVRERWATAPSLHPLSYWPVAWARLLSNPQVSAKTMVVILVSIPLGTPGQVVVAAGAAWMAGLYVTLNLTATVRAAFAAGRWLAPTPVRFGPFATTLISRVFIAQLAVSTGAVIAVAALAKPVWVYVAASAEVAWLLLFISIALLACVLARRVTFARWSSHS